MSFGSCEAALCLFYKAAHITDSVLIVIVRTGPSVCTKVCLAVLQFFVLMFNCSFVAFVNTITAVVCVSFEFCKAIEYCIVNTQRIIKSGLVCTVYGP